MSDHDPEWIEQQLARQNQSDQLQTRIEQLAETLRSQTEGEQYIPPEERGIDIHQVDWQQLLSTEPDISGRWIIPDLVATGRNHAFIASAGAGKSELLLWAIARAAQGIGIYSEQIEPVRTLYLDYEMGPDDLRERMQSFGYTPDHDLSNLLYLQPPELGELDRQPKADDWPGEVLVTYATEQQIDLVIIDTFSRAVEGEENSNDTIRNYYRHTGQMLKTAGIAQIRLDHTGHSDTSRARGGSAKAADIDVSMILKSDKKENRTTIERGKARMGWWPERLVFNRFQHEQTVEYSVASTAAQPATPKPDKYTDPQELALFLRQLYPTNRPSYQIAHDALAQIGASWQSREVLRMALDLWPDPYAFDSGG